MSGKCGRKSTSDTEIFSLNKSISVKENLTKKRKAKLREEEFVEDIIGKDQ